MPRRRAAGYLVDTDRSRIAARKIDLSGVGEGVFAHQLGNVRSLGKGTDHRRIAAGRRTIRRNDNIPFVLARDVPIGQRIEVPDDTHLNLSLFHIGREDIDRQETFLFGEFSIEVDRGLQIGLATTESEGSCQNPYIRLRRLADLSYRYLVVAMQQVGESLGRVLDAL